MYTLLKNYEILWNLVNSGETVVCFVNDEIVRHRDVCKCVKRLEGGIEFLVKGYGYSYIFPEYDNLSQKDMFISECKRMNVEFIDSSESIASIVSTRERILCAAVHVDDGKKYADQPANIHRGYVVTGHRHLNCYATLAITLGEHVANGIRTHHTQKRTLNINFEGQGFLTSANNYVTRREAWKIAKDNGQIVFGLDTCDFGDDSILISENLY